MPECPSAYHGGPEDPYGCGDYTPALAPATDALQAPQRAAEAVGTPTLAPGTTGYPEMAANRLFLTEDEVAPIERLVIDRAQLTEADAVDLAWDVMRSVTSLVCEQIAKQADAEVAHWMRLARRPGGSVGDAYTQGSIDALRSLARKIRGEG